MRIHLAGEHPAELEPLDLLLDLVDVGADGTHELGIAFRFRKLEQFLRLGEAVLEPVERLDDGLEACTLAPEFLRPVRVVPDARILEFPQDLRQPLAAPLVVKDTP